VLPTEDRPVRTTRWTARDVLVVGLILGSVFLSFDLPYNLAPVDALLVLVNLVGLGILARGGSFPSRLFASALPFLWVLLAASVFALFGDGLPSWAVDGLVRNLVSLLTFFTLLAVIATRPESGRRYLNALLVAGVVVAVSVLASSGVLRASGTFRNPNYAGHFLAVAIVLCLFAPRWARPRAPWRWGLALLFAAALLRTGSFGSLIMLIAVALYAGWKSVGRGDLARFTRVLILMAAAGAAVLALQADLETVDRGSGLSGERFARSSDSRFELWQDAIGRAREHPMGVGLGSYGARDDLNLDHELHSDPLTFLLEAGPFGFLAVAAIAALLWRNAPPSGVARLLMVGLLASSLFRNTFNFRHVWVALALAYALDRARWRRPTAPASTASYSPPTDSTPNRRRHSSRTRVRSTEDEPSTARSSAARNEVTEPASASQPVAPSVTASWPDAGPPVATTGVPQAMASSSELDNPSYRAAET
jgi:O-antigen ligase